MPVQSLRVSTRRIVKAEGEQGGGLPTQHAGEKDSRSVAADLAQELNEEIRVVGGSLLGRAEASEELIFYCECGCLDRVQLSLAAFDASGRALLEGHSRPQGAS